LRAISELTGISCQFVIGRVDVEEAICGCGIASGQQSYQLVTLGEQRSEPYSLPRSEERRVVGLDLAP
jgi:hypothetical protein